MKNIILLIGFFLLNACSKDLIQPLNNPSAVFEETSRYIEETYSYLNLKQLDWPSIHNKYKAKIQDNMSEDSLFSVCAAMMFELKDGHCYLSNTKGNSNRNVAVFDFTKGYYVTPSQAAVLSYITDVREWPANEELITGMIKSSVSIGYVYFNGFADTDKVSWQSIMEYFKSKNVKKIIIDIRTNSGGSPALAQWLCGYFVKSPTKVGAMYQKNGKDKNDFIGPLTLTTEPRQPYLGDIPLVLLTNRASFSAASYLSGMMEALPNVTQMGQITGGGGGGARPFELPNGWTIAITANYYLDVKGRHIELGVVPDVLVENTAQDFAAGKDKMLEAAIAF